MLKMISAALIATSLLAAPAMATTLTHTHRAPVAKTVVIKPSIANAQARFVKRHRGPVFHNHRHGHKVVIVKKHRHFH